MTEHPRRPGDVHPRTEIALSPANIAVASVALPVPAAAPPDAPRGGAALRQTLAALPDPTKYP